MVHCYSAPAIGCPRSAPATWQTPIESSTSGLAISITDGEKFEADTDPPYIVELGAGTGVLGLVCHAVNGDIDVRLTDRYTDLIAENVETVMSTGSRRGKERYATLEEALDYYQMSQNRCKTYSSLTHPSESKAYQIHNYKHTEPDDKSHVVEMHLSKKRTREQSGFADNETLCTW